MQIEQCALEELFSDVKTFFDGHAATSFVHTRPSITNIKKHCYENTKVEFTSHLCESHSFELPNPEHRTGSSAREALAQLEEISRSWRLPLGEASLIGNKLFLKLSRQHAFQSVLADIFHPGNIYGQRAGLNLKIFISHAECPVSPLSEHRLHLLANITKRLVQHAGYSLANNETDADKHLLYTLTTPSGPGFIHCGYVTDASCNRIQIKVQDYLKLRENDMQALSEHKYWAAGHETTIKALAEASLIMDLINVKTESTIKLCTDVGVIKRESSSRGASFILYNYSRLSAIEMKFAELVASGVYPELPSLKDIDLTLLNQQEEWAILFDHLLEYPHLLNRIIAQLDEGKVHQHLLCHFLHTFSNSISVYYHRCRVLQDPKPHLLPIIFARMTFIKAIKKVLHHALEIVNIPTVDIM